MAKIRVVEIDISEVRRLLSYDPETGDLKWKIQVSHKSPVGSVAGWKSNGYLCLSILRRQYYCHRVAWALHYGEWPDQLIDHKNRVKSDNKISNLRLANESQNAENQQSAQSNNRSSGLLGVTWMNRKNPWVAQISSRGVARYLGHFSTPEAAQEAYLAAKKSIHKFATI